MLEHNTELTRLHKQDGEADSAAKARTLARTLAISNTAETLLPTTSAMQMPSLVSLSGITSK